MSAEFQPPEGLRKGLRPVLREWLTGLWIGAVLLAFYGWPLIAVLFVWVALTHG